MQVKDFIDDNLIDKYNYLQFKARLRYDIKGAG